MTDPARTDDLPWWLRPGPETCPHCLRGYHLEVGYHCVDCDGPVCPFCVVSVRATETVHYCPDCRPDGGRP